MKLDTSFLILQNRLVFLPSLTQVYRDGWEWWASVELGRRLLLILLTVSLPQHMVNYWLLLTLCILQRIIVSLYATPFFLCALQGIILLVLAVYTTVHGYIQPYRVRLTNLLEIAVNVNFCMLLLIVTTPYFYDDLFIFPSHTEDTECSGIHNSIAQVIWILMPVYYLPLLGASVTATVLTICSFR